MPNRFLFFALATSLVFASCAGTRRFGRTLQKNVQNSPVFSHSLTGFTLFDPEKGKTIADVNGDHYFTPASNTKILTLYTCLKILGDSVPGMIWVQDEKSTGFAPIGDPTFLHPRFQAWQQIFHDIKSASPEQDIHVADILKDDITPLGPGWAWDDLNYDYSAERTFFPMYGNVKRVFAVTGDSVDVEPSYWRPNLIETGFIHADSLSCFQQQDDNSIWYDATVPVRAGYEDWLPVRGANKYLQALLEDTLGRHVTWGGDYERVGGRTFPVRYSCPVDTVYRRIMYQSDNFIAEQMLLVASGKHSGFYLLNQDSVINWMLDNALSDLPQRPRWVDGSGLSRYNLASPRDFVQVLMKLWREQPHERLFSLFPAGGVSGTLSGWYRGENGKPYVFAKSGSMSGVQCLSGYMLTKRNKVLIFSFMHNNFVGSGKPWKEEMSRMLGYIRDHY